MAEDKDKKYICPIFSLGRIMRGIPKTENSPHAVDTCIEEDCMFWINTPKDSDCLEGCSIMALGTLAMLEILRRKKR